MSILTSSSFSGSSIKIHTGDIHNDKPDHPKLPGFGLSATGTMLDTDFQQIPLIDRTNDHEIDKPYRIYGQNNQYFIYLGMCEKGKMWHRVAVKLNIW